jgi:endonuclease YncB( thermonuclease family)
MIVLPSVMPEKSLRVETPPLTYLPEISLLPDQEPVTIVSCYDADTCRVNLPRSAFNDDWAYDLFGHNIPIRVEGIDTPESVVGAIIAGSLVILL